MGVCQLERCVKNTHDRRSVLRRRRHRATARGEFALEFDSELVADSESALVHARRRNSEEEALLLSPHAVEDAFEETEKEWWDSPERDNSVQWLLRDAAKRP
ncbi:MAG: hypothetical protein ACP5R4_12310, partial [Armatimonadota bacterium]